MSKSGLHYLMVACCLASSSLSAAETLFSNAPITSAPPPIMSPSEFTSHAKELGKQTQAQLSQEVKADLKKPAPPGAPSAPAAPVNPTAATNPVSTNPAPPEVAPLPEAEAPGGTQAETPGATTQAAPSAPGSIYTPPPQSTNQNQPYTGFGAGTNTNNNNNNKAPAKSSGGTSGGWNIKY
ncbi:MAG: hypothetical protein P4M14_09965 [Gammaproteobacteria bacterium]|nr:hypothetical protein [Gammaproteobacteria bacterium]